MSLKSWRASFTSVAFYDCGCTVVHLLSRDAVFKDLIRTGRLSFTWMASNSSQTSATSLAAALPTSLKRYLYLPSHHHSQLPPNFYQEKIFFSHSNIDLCNRAWKTWSCPFYVWHTWNQWKCLSPSFTFHLPLTQGFSLPFGLGLWQDFREVLDCQSWPFKEVAMIIVVI